MCNCDDYFNYGLPSISPYHFGFTTKTIYEMFGSIYWDCFVLMEVLHHSMVSLSHSITVDSPYSYFENLNIEELHFKSEHHHLDQEYLGFERVHQQI